MKDGSIYDRRPFKTRNAEEFDLSQVLPLFVEPVPGGNSPFEFENSIVKGRMGTGKTMYLKANYAYYLYTLVPALLEKKPLVLPVFLRLSDFQHLENPSDVYNAVIVKIIEELSQLYLKLQDAQNMARIHLGIRTWPADMLPTSDVKEITGRLCKLTADEYVETVTDKLGLNGGVKPKFFEASVNYSKDTAVHVKRKDKPGINDVFDAYRILLEGNGGKILILIDEAGSLSKSFFVRQGETCFFEILMNQLRTAEYIRTKIAVYPHSYSDILTETRYGDMVSLSENIRETVGYERFRGKAIAMISRYLTVAAEEPVVAGDIFELSPKDSGDGLEQMINASDGNTRRLTQILDTAMTVAAEQNEGQDKVAAEHARQALLRHADSMIQLYGDPEKEFLESIAKVCRSRATFKFQFPYKSPVLSKYVSKSEEYNVLSIVDVGAGRKGTTYAFDFAYCVRADIPTHYFPNSEKIEKSRSISKGVWITRVANISEDVIQHAKMPGKLEGTISYLSKDGDVGFIQTEDKVDYFFRQTDLATFDRDKNLRVGLRVRFFPAAFQDSKWAAAVELL